MECEVCGSSVSQTKNVSIDDVAMTVCRNCSKLGTEIRAPPKRKIRLSEVSLTEDVVLVSGFGRRVKEARESRRLSQEELAGEIGIKSSFIRRIESGSECHRDMMRKVERFLSISLYEAPSIGVPGHDEKSHGLTLGDIATIKRKKS